MRAIGLAILSFLSKFAVALSLFILLKILFYLFNYNYFELGQFKLIIGALRFDWMTVGVLFLPLWFTHLVFYKGKSIVLKVLFHLSNTLALLANTLDLEYYKFTLKRTTADLFKTQGITGDVASLLPQFLKDYWYLFVLFILFIVLSEYLYRKTQRIDVPSLKWYHYPIYFAITFAFITLSFRGGAQYKPLDIIQAGQYAKGKNTALVLNTPFSIIKTLNDKGLEKKNYFLEKDLDSIYSPIQSFTKDSILRNSNVVILIMESFSKEYIGAYNNNQTFTPFLDSLINHSLSFKKSFANGKKSIEALPSILSGIPSLMDDSYISSKYGSNDINSLASTLKKYDYTSTFYHGGANGTMGFDAFTSLAGFDRYLGLNEYPNENDYDGNWGIFDEPFLQYVIQDLNEGKKPFLANIFTLSSHHPYTIPKEHQGKFEKGPLPIHESIGYADYALKQFFKNASKEDWFENTLFIITADHTAQSHQKKYGTLVGIYEVPIIFYHPAHQLDLGEDSIVAQQSDIYPTVIDWLGVDETIFSFGNSILNSDEEHFSISYINNTYQLIQGKYALQSDGNTIIALYDYESDPLLKNDISKSNKEITEKMNKKLHAIIQQYNNALIQNLMLPI